MFKSNIYNSCFNKLYYAIKIQFNINIKEKYLLKWFYLGIVNI